MMTDVEKMRVSFSTSPRPSSNVMKRLMAADSEPDITPNISTKPATAL